MTPYISLGFVIVTSYNRNSNFVPINIFQKFYETALNLIRAAGGMFENVSPESLKNCNIKRSEVEIFQKITVLSAKFQMRSY
jgi:hypothetical protein